jgi:hypothetical protein
MLLKIERGLIKNDKKNMKRIIYLEIKVVYIYRSIL